MSTNNHPELCGVETTLRQLVDKYNMAQREGTLLAMADALSDIEYASVMAGFKINELIRRR